jgi:hypothetical protein
VEGAGRGGGAGGGGGGGGWEWGCGRGRGRARVKVRARERGRVKVRARRRGRARVGATIGDEGGGECGGQWWGGRAGRVAAHGVGRDALGWRVLVEADRVGRHRVREELLLQQTCTDAGHPRRQLLEHEAAAVMSHRATALLHAPAVHLLPHGLGRGAQLCGHLQLIRLAQVVGDVVDRVDAAHAIPLEVHQRRWTSSAAAPRQPEGRQRGVQLGVLWAVPRPVPAAQEEVRPRLARRAERA